MKKILSIVLALGVLAACSSTERQTSRLSYQEDSLQRAAELPFDQMVVNARSGELLLGSIPFPDQSPAITPAAAQQLNAVAQQILQRDGVVVIEGHANGHDVNHNRTQLGYERAIAVAKYLKNQGIWEERLIVKSFGDQRPVDAHDARTVDQFEKHVVVKMFASGEGMSGKSAIKAYDNTLKDSKGTDAGQNNSFGLGFLMPPAAAQ
jgi:outer membrane protein OmpA-like peptidoglycan-associated protein